MKLLLTSSGFTNNTISTAFTDLAGKEFDQLRLIYIPTAVGREIGDLSWMQDDISECKKQGFASVDVVDFSVLKRDEWMKAFENADVLLFGGGSTVHLLEMMKKCGVDKELSRLLETRVYIGISAGSMVVSQYLDLSIIPPLYQEDYENDGRVGGVGLVDFQVIPHLNSDFYTNVTIENISKVITDSSDVFYAIDDQSAIVVNDSTISVVSEGQWQKLYN